jgi:hypothetical protein
VSEPCSCGRPSWAEVHEMLEMERRHAERQRQWAEFLEEWRVLLVGLGAEDRES